MRTGIFLGSFNPPGLHHLSIVDAVSSHFTKIIIAPAVFGQNRRHDATQITRSIIPIHRAALLDLAFKHMQKNHIQVEIELVDLERNLGREPLDLIEHYATPDDRPWLIVGTDVFGVDSEGTREFAEWPSRDKLWAHESWAIVPFDGYPYEQADLPPNHTFFDTPIRGNTAHIRECIYRRRDYRSLVLPEVADYIQRYHLYEGVVPPTTTQLPVTEARLRIVPDTNNPKALEIAERLKAFESANPNLIVSVGGDGHMLRTIREFWRERIPFLGINAGHLGFLLNHEQSITPPHSNTTTTNTHTHTQPTFLSEFTCHQLPFLYVETCDTLGKWSECIAVNDAWVERETGQTAWLRVKINGEVQLDCLQADGILISTAAGSTAYANAMGASPLPVSAPILAVVGSNVIRPRQWRPVYLSLHSSVEFEALDVHKRPIRAFIDGRAQGTCHAMRIRVSRVAGAQLCFAPGSDLSMKLAQLQFPKC
eukprot:gnl/Trimastix_PCT/3168.p1 GENE.gnl/Trimastix_PCT/3168~~gnl/Trimastix_PCT/3168.p1  ORF type:complete len:504 (+),score=79.31 gnl/Trimastix_PCT/3168:71-1513(+)